MKSYEGRVGDHSPAPIKNWRGPREPTNGADVMADRRAPVVN